MAINTELTALKFLNIQTGVELNCNFPLFAEDEVEVVYGFEVIEAVRNVDYTVELNPDDSYINFTVTPLAALLTKINALIDADTADKEINYATVRRKLELKSTNQPNTVRDTVFLSREIDRTNMKIQQVAEEGQRALVISAKEAGSADTRYFVDPPVDGRTVIWNEDRRTFVQGPTASEVEGAQGFAEIAEGHKDDAAASAADALVTLSQVQALYDNFGERYLGVKTADPVTDNDGQALIDGALYFNTTSNIMRIYDLGNTTWNDVTTSLLDGSVTTAKLANLAVTAAKLAADAVTWLKLNAAIYGGLAANEDNKLLKTRDVWNEAEYVALTEAASIAVDGSQGWNFSVTLTDNRTLANPTNMKPGQSGDFLFTQDATGSRVLTFAANYINPTGVSLSTAPDVTDMVFYKVKSATEIVITGILRDV